MPGWREGADAGKVRVYDVVWGLRVHGKSSKSSQTELKRSNYTNHISYFRQ
jgi:hypothetical protein